MALGLPSVNIQFIQEGITAIQRGNRGVVALILEEAEAMGEFTISDITDIPEGLREENRQLVVNALLGNTYAPLKIELFVLKANSEQVAALDHFESVYFDYLAFPSATEEQKTEIVAWIKALREQGIMRKAVLANKNADYEGIINVTQGDVRVGEKTYSASEFTARVAGLLAGTDLRVSTTYTVLPEVDYIPYEKRDVTAEKVSNGEFVLIREARKIRVARGVTSLTSTIEGKGSLFQKIKVADVMDLIANDIKRTATENYLGKYANSYDNKCLLISAIRSYLDKLVIEGLVEKNTPQVDIDMEQQRAFLKGIGVDLTTLTEQEIKEYNTEDKIFLRVSCKILDAIEEISIRIFI